MNCILYSSNTIADKKTTPRLLSDLHPFLRVNLFQSCSIITPHLLYIKHPFPNPGRNAITIHCNCLRPVCFSCSVPLCFSASRAPPPHPLHFNNGCLCYICQYLYRIRVPSSSYFQTSATGGSQQKLTPSAVSIHLCVLPLCSCCVSGHHCRQCHSPFSITTGCYHSSSPIPHALPNHLRKRWLHRFKFLLCLHPSRCHSRFCQLQTSCSVHLVSSGGSVGHVCGSCSASFWSRCTRTTYRYFKHGSLVICSLVLFTSLLPSKSHSRSLSSPRHIKTNF